MISPDRTTVSLRLLIAAALAFGGSFALAHENLDQRMLDPTDDSQQSQTFDQLDLNGDGAISRSELPADSDLIEQFDSLDENHDGKLSREEFLAQAGDRGD